MRAISDIKSELKAICEVGIAAGERGDEPAVLFADEQVAKLSLELKSAERDLAIRGIGQTGEFRIENGQAPGSDLATALLAEGWNRKTRPTVTVGIDHALRLKTGSLDGGSDIEDAVPSRFVAPLLGVDARYLYPRLRSQGVASDATGITSYRQKSRTLGTPSNMIQAIDYTSAKEETDSVAEVVSVPLKMIANVSSGTPNILLANDSFRQFVNADLLAAYRNAVDFHIVDAIGDAGIAAGGGGDNVFENILYSQEVVRAAGYDPSLVVMSPADALAVQLLQLSSGTTYAFNQPLPAFVVSPSVEDDEGFVCDPGALGILFLGSFTFATFEENNGTTNTSTVRGESSGLFLVQRPDAAATLSGAS